MKAVKKYSNGGPLTEEERRAIKFKIKALKGEIGVVNRTSPASMSDENKAAEIKRLQARIANLQAKL